MLFATTEQNQSKAVYMNFKMKIATIVCILAVTIALYDLSYAKPSPSVEEVESQEKDAQEQLIGTILGAAATGKKIYDLGKAFKWWQAKMEQMDEDESATMKQNELEAALNEVKSMQEDDDEGEIQGLVGAGCGYFCEKYLPSSVCNHACKKINEARAQEEEDTGEIQGLVGAGCGYFCGKYLPSSVCNHACKKMNEARAQEEEDTGETQGLVQHGCNYVCGKYLPSWACNHACKKMKEADEQFIHFHFG